MPRKGEKYRRERWMRPEPKSQVEELITGIRHPREVQPSLEQDLFLQALKRQAEEAVDALRDLFRAYLAETGPMDHLDLRAQQLAEADKEALSQTEQAFVEWVSRFNLVEDWIIERFKETPLTDPENPSTADSLTQRFLEPWFQPENDFVIGKEVLDRAFRLYLDPYLPHKQDRKQYEKAARAYFNERLKIYLDYQEQLVASRGYEKEKNTAIEQHLENAYDRAVWYQVCGLKIDEVAIKAGLAETADLEKEVRRILKEVGIKRRRQQRRSR